MAPPRRPFLRAALLAAGAAAALAALPAKPGRTAPPAAPAEVAPAPSLDEAVARAEAVLRAAASDGVSAAREADAVFAAAAALATAGDRARAGGYYRRGLQLAPWDLDAQLAYARVLAADGQTAAARAAAALVHATTERQSPLEESARLADLPLPPPLPPLPEEPLSRKGLLILAVGDVDPWLLARAGRRLGETLGMPVHAAPRTLDLPPPDRSYHDRWVENLKKDVVWEHPWVRSQMRELRIASRENATADQTLELVARIMVAQDQPDPRAELARVRAQVRARDRQWSADRLLDLAVAAAPLRGDVVLVGLTAADIHGGDTNFLFGTARTGGDACLVSCARFTAGYNDERESQPRLLDRLHKQLLSSVGFALGVPRPTDPRSARSYPASLADHDLKGTWLSPACLEGFARALGHPLPEPTLAATAAALAPPAP